MVVPVTIPITGNEDPIDPREPRGALCEFYRAFNQRDLELMEANWTSMEDVSMDNPVGGIRRGWSEIRKVYVRIFNSPARVQVEFFDYTFQVWPETALAVGRERGSFVAEGVTLDLMIRTSRLFARRDGRWCQIHHHGSIEDPDLLARYQAATR